VHLVVEGELGQVGADGGAGDASVLVDALARFREVVAEERSNPHRLSDLAVDGNDLIRLGFEPGPQLGRILNELLDAVVDEPALNTREVLLARAKERL